MTIFGWSCLYAYLFMSIFIPLESVNCYFPVCSWSSGSIEVHHPNNIYISYACNENKIKTFICILAIVIHIHTPSYSQLFPGRTCLYSFVSFITWYPHLRLCPSLVPPHVYSQLRQAAYGQSFPSASIHPDSWVPLNFGGRMGENKQQNKTRNPDLNVDGSMVT